MCIARFCLMLACGLFLTDFAAAEESAGRSRESFNRDWRFERFGPMPDGSTKPEPGGPGCVEHRREHSSEELDKGNLAENAFDNDPDSRWCAENPGVNQWLAARLGPRDETRRHRSRLGVSRSDLQIRRGRERQRQEMESVGRRRIPRTDRSGCRSPPTARYLRVRTTALPQGKWASIREIRLFDADEQTDSAIAA